MAKFNKVMLRLRALVFRKYDYRCAACGWACDLEIDHVYPRKTLLAMGIDLNDPDWWQCLCHHCNNKKNAIEGLPKLDPIELTAEELEILNKAAIIVNNRRTNFIQMLEQHRATT